MMILRSSASRLFVFSSTLPLFEYTPATNCIPHHKLLSINMSEEKSPSIMDPLPGHTFVEYHKDGGDGSSSKEKADAGLDVERKARHDPSRIYLSRVEPPASTKLNVGDRLVALNGKSVESFGGDLGAIRTEFKRNNVVQLVVDQTMLKK
jgi:hypothetical protein